MSSKTIHLYPDEIEDEIKTLKNNWSGKYPLAVKSWEQNWDKLTVVLHFPEQIRKIIHTTNIIENFNASLRKYTKNK